MVLEFGALGLLVVGALTSLDFWFFSGIERGASEDFTGRVRACGLQGCRVCDFEL